MRHNPRAIRGITLVEVITSMAVIMVFGSLVYSFILFSSKSMRKMVASQLMQQESSLISEIFMRTVRNASFITVGTDTVPPRNDTMEVAQISAFYPDGRRSMLRIHGQYVYFIDDWSVSAQEKILTRYLWQGDTLPNCFNVFTNGDHVSFSVNLFRTVGDDSLFLPHTVGDVRCKN